MAPEGLLERWFVADGAAVRAGDRLAEVRIEDCLHEIVSPAAGVVKLARPSLVLVEPDEVVAEIVPERI